MKKSIFLFFAAILCAMSVSAKTIYLNAGGSGFWDRDGAVFTAKVSGTEYGMTKVFGSYYEGAIPDDATKVTFMRNDPNGGNWNKTDELTIPTDGKNCYTITGWSYGDWSLFPPTCIVAGTPGELFNNKEWNVTAEENKMTYEGNGVFKLVMKDVTFDTKQDCACKVTFNGDWSGAIGTSDGQNYTFTLEAGKTYDITFTYDMKTNAFDVATIQQIDPIMKTIYCKMEHSWWTQSNAAISAYVWGIGGGSSNNTGIGTLMELAPYEDNVWKITLDIAQYQWIRFIRVNQEGTNDWGARTSGQEIPTDAKNLFTITNSDAAWNSDGNKCTGEWSTYVELTEDPATYIIAGAELLLGSYWSTSDVNNKMQNQADGTCTLTKNRVELSKTGKYEYKVTKNGTYLNNLNGGNNYVLEVDKNGYYDITFSLSADRSTLTTNAVCVEEKDVVLKCYVAGTTNLVGGTNDFSDKIEMEYTEATETYTYKFSSLAPDTYLMKIVYGDDWLGFDKLATPVPANVTEGDDNKIQFTLAEAGDVVVTYNLEAGIGLTGNFAEPAPEVPVTLYFVNAENWTNLKAHIWVDPSGVSYKPWEESESLTDTGNDHNGADIYSYTFSNKYNRIIWKGDDAKQTTNDVAAYDVAKPYYCQGVWYASLSEIPAVVEKKYYVKGTHNEWTADATSEMTLDGEVYKKEVTLAKDVEFKINDGASGWWGKDNLGGKSYNELEGLEGGNLKMKEAKTFTIIFNPAENLITFENLTEKAPVVVTYQLKGVGGWEQPGIEMEQNPGKASEYMLTCQAISATDAIKVVRLENGEIKDDYGNGTVKDGVEVTVNYDDAGNITLPEGKYNFYFDTNEPEKKLWIAAATDCETVTEITLTEGDNSSALATEGVVTVTVDRDFEKDNLYTIALPFTINNAASVFGNGTVVYNFANLAYDKTNEEYILGFTKVSKIEAGKPYLIEPGQDVNGFVAENVTLSSATSVSKTVKVDNVEKTATMTAVLSKTTTGGSYWLAEDRYLYNGEVNMPALRALFVLPTTPSGMPARARVALKEDAATGVEDLFTTDAPVKVIQNGQLIIIRDGVKYNVQGQVIR